ncbi:MAG: ribosomal protection-like ABC-F family protein [Bacteroidota bacterium]
MLSVNNISVQFNGEFLFENISYIVNKRDRIGLVGKNGAGKTTMLRIISGQFTPESGQIVKPSGFTIGYLPQEMKLRSQKPLLEETFTAFAEANALENQINTLTQQLAHRVDFESAEYQKLIDNLAIANERYDLIEGDTRKAKAEKVLLGLGFERDDFSKPMSEYSGGWQMRVELAKILLQNPDLLLLDEPTNHLDIESIQWMEGFLADYAGALILISHDRAFLDNVTKRTIEISNGKIYDYKAAFSDYEILRQERLEQESSEFANQQREIEQIERFINRFRAKATKAKQVQSRIKLLEKMDRIEVDEPDMSGIHFRFNQAPPSGKVVLEAQNISKSYGEKKVLENLNFLVSRGERIAFVGRNGEGKTTLSRIIIDELHYEGNLIKGHNVVIGYYAQNQAEFLDGEKTVFQTLDDVAVGDIRSRIRNILGGFLFQGDEVDKKVKVLSGGEKSRLAIARLLLSPVNVLVLDEPTNHLDMRSKDILKSALLKFEGTVIIVSHDRDFLQSLTTRIFEFKNRQIKEYLGDIYDFIEKRNLSNLTELNQKKQKSQNSKNTSASENKMLWERKKELEKRKRKIDNSISRIEEEINELEEKLSKLETFLSDPSQIEEKSQYNKILNDYSALKKEMEIKENKWEKLHLELEDLEKNYPLS